VIVVFVIVVFVIVVFVFHVETPCLVVISQGAMSFGALLPVALPGATAGPCPALAPFLSLFFFCVRSQDLGPHQARRL
jgi:hypothetical protein